MTKEDAEYVDSKIENEGFHYTFIDYSDFNDIEDKQFHKLRIEYENSAKALKDYIQSQL